jgi:SAM-dependent methyltransferase
MAELLERWFAISAPSWAATTMRDLGVEEGEASVGDRFPVGDVGGRALTRTSRRAAPTVSYQDGTAEALPLPDGSATVAWSLATVHHWHDLDTGLNEVRRVLRPSGRLLALERQVEPRATGLASHGWTDEQAHLFAQRCRTAGFTNISIDRHQPGRPRLLSVLAHTT